MCCEQRIDLVALRESLGEGPPSDNYWQRLCDQVPAPPTGAKSQLREVWGQWPGNESIDEILSLLRETSAGNAPAPKGA